MTRRSRSSEVVRVQGQVVERQVPSARPLPFDQPEPSRPQIIFIEREPAMAPVRHGALVLAYLVGILAAVVLAVFVLSWVGVLDWAPVDVPWKPGR